jgi:NAD(P)-dependent dehydrogenase (short-subunit alcohol dehydrogenase family)
VLSKQAVNLYIAKRCVSLAQQGIRINSISPGAVDTGMRRHFEEVVGTDAFASVGSVIGRVAEPQEPANVLVFLLSDAATYVTGSNVLVDGGFMASIVASQGTWT